MPAANRLSRTGSLTRRYAVPLTPNPGIHTSKNMSLIPAKVLSQLARIADKPSMPRMASRLIRSLIKRTLKFGGFSENGFTHSVYGVWLADQWSDATFRLCAAGSYGFFYADWLSRLKTGTFIDIGANQGLYSLLAGRNRDIRKIYAFEPQPNVFARLRKNIDKNGFANIESFPFAISSKAGKSLIYVPEGHSGAATLSDRDIGATSRDSVSIESVDQSFLDNQIRIDTDDRIAIKIDTEGHEEEVIGVLRKSRLWDRVFNIFYEVDERYLKNHQQLLDSLLSEGFSLVYKNGSGQHYDLMLQR